MSIDIIMQINADPLKKQFLRENSYWYKYLNRSNTYYKDFIQNMKEIYKLTPSDKIEKIANNINMFKTILDVIK